MITVRDLSWQYEPLVDGGKPVDSLKHVSFDIKSGSFVGVIVPTGAGKSTLMKRLARAAEQRGELTHDCRRGSCTGCGVCQKLGVQVKVEG